MLKIGTSFLPDALVGGKPCSTPLSRDAAFQSGPQNGDLVMWLSIAYLEATGKDHPELQDMRTVPRPRTICEPCR